MDEVHAIEAINRFCITGPIISTIPTTKALPIKNARLASGNPSVHP
jgi:hypothetical protein